ncbi:MAG TPA: acyltransferase, partial [Dehalococcoidia bacterium]
MYRPDIDGLRALAVLAVILFHAGVPGFAGGYVGVDVFFVISGYLITQLLSAPHPGGAARQLGEFYVRRARRILPALLVMCAAAALIGWLLLLPGELVDLGEYLAGAAVFASNMTEWHGGYFVRAFADPLRHLWSIAVEEQFYLLYPLLLLLLTRYLPRRRTAALASLGLSSLLLCAWAAYAHPAVNYYAAPTRAWELLLGAVLQSAGLRALRPRWANELLAALAALTLAACVHLYVPGRFPYPSVYTLLPCAATAALLATGGEGSSYVNRVLAWPPLVFVGLISYSLYLWHWPLLRFAGYYHVTPLGGATRAALLALIVLLSIASWRYVEQPVRRRRVLQGTRALVLAAALASAAIALTGLVLWLSDGFPRRFPPELRALLDEPKGPLIARCMDKSLDAIRAGGWCAFGDASPAAAA